MLGELNTGFIPDERRRLWQLLRRVSFSKELKLNICLLMNSMKAFSR
jgi:hypothetical protein